MKKQYLLIFILLNITNSLIAQKFYFDLKGTDSIIGKEAIIEYKDGFRQTQILDNNDINIVRLKHLKNSELNYIKLKVDKDTLWLQYDANFQDIGINITSVFDEIINDTLSVFLDTFPYKHKGSQFIVNRYSLNELPDYRNFVIVHINNDSYMIKWPEFKKEEFSNYFSDLIKDDFCKCMSKKEVNQTNIQDAFQSCLEEPMTKIIPLMDTTLKNYISIEDTRNYETRVTEFINETLYKLNIYYNENCLKK